MDLGVLAAKAVKRISRRDRDYIYMTKRASHIPAVYPTVLTGDRYVCGYAESEVMPDDLNESFYGIAGHGPGRKVEGVHDPLTVRAMWIGVGEGGVLHVSADIIGLTNTEVNRIRESLAVFCKITNCAAINISCTHSHGSFDTVGYWGRLPLTGKVPAYMQKLSQAIRDVCIRAYQSRRAGALSVGAAHVPEALSIAREPKVYHDTLTRLRFVPDDGSEEIWFLNFAAHPNTLGGGNRKISADYPYFMRERIRRESTAHVLFGIGAIGAVNPGEFSDNNWERTRVQGETLGAAALAISNDRALSPEIKVITQPFYYPVDNPVLNFLSMLKVMSAAKYPSPDGALKLALKSEMSYIRLGSLNILLLPGEEFPALAYGGYRDANHSATGEGPEINPAPLVQIAGDEELLIFGVTNDMAGYVVPPNEFILNAEKPYLDTAYDKYQAKHYHETNSLGYGAAETIATVFAGLAARMDATGE